MLRELGIDVHLIYRWEKRTALTMDVGLPLVLCELPMLPHLWNGYMTGRCQYSVPVRVGKDLCSRDTWSCST